MRVILGIVLSSGYELMGFTCSYELIGFTCMCHCNLLNGFSSQIVLVSVVQVERVIGVIVLNTQIFIGEQRRGK